MACGQPSVASRRFMAELGRGLQPQGRSGTRVPEALWPVVRHGVPDLRNSPGSVNGSRCRSTTVSAERMAFRLPGTRPGGRTPAAAGADPPADAGSAKGRSGGSRRHASGITAGRHGVSANCRMSSLPMPCRSKHTGPNPLPHANRSHRIRPSHLLELAFVPQRLKHRAEQTVGQIDFARGPSSNCT